MGSKLSGKVVVITGASSGIGRAAARQFAEQGANLVLAARGEAPLEDVASQCRQRGVRAVAVPTDVADEGAVHHLAEEALRLFGRVDVWINNAATFAFGEFSELPPQAFRRVVETNFFGTVHGARAALPIFRRQGFGVLINNVSMLGKMAAPLATPYIASKHAVRGLAMSLRQEQALDGHAAIHICTMMPSTVDTPFYQHVANYTGRAAKAMPPVYSAEKVARALVACAAKPRREFFVGNASRLMNVLFTLSGTLSERVFARVVARYQLHQAKPQAATDGNLYRPMVEEARVSGGWGTFTGIQAEDWKRRAPVYRRALAACTALSLAMGAGGILLWRLWRSPHAGGRQLQPWLS